MSPLGLEALRTTRLDLVREHVDAEQRGDWEGALATFSRARYEITPTGEIHDGIDAVRAFYAETARAFPEVSFATRAMYHDGSSVLVEVMFEGVHAGNWRGLPATDRKVRYAMCNVFEFEEERLVCERMYFDLLTPLRQVGVARDPASLVGRVAMVLNHPLTVVGAVLRQATSAARNTRRETGDRSRT